MSCKPSQPTSARVKKFELTWGRTYPDVGRDYIATDPAFTDPNTGEPLKVGRVYQMTGGPAADHWFWTMTALINNRQASDSGTMTTCNEACHKVEERYRQFLALIAG